MAEVPKVYYTVTVDGVTREEFLLNPDTAPSLLELGLLFAEGKSRDKTVAVTPLHDGQPRSFTMESDLDYSGWLDSGELPLKKNGMLAVKGLMKVLPDHFYLRGRVGDTPATLSVYPDEVPEEAEYCLTLNPQVEVEAEVEDLY